MTAKKLLVIEEMVRGQKFYPSRRLIRYGVMMMMMTVYGWCLFSTQDEVVTHAVVPSLNDTKGKIYILYCYIIKKLI